MLLSYTGPAGTFFFSRPVKSDANKYTVIVGKNGTGKSRLLRSVIAKILRDDDRENAVLDRDSRRYLEEEVASLIDLERSPARIIAVSTNPFDRFPLISRARYTHPRYSYLGTRGLPSQNLGFAYLSRITSGLIDAVVKQSSQAKAISGVLTYLGYQPAIYIQFAPLPESLTRELLASGDVREQLEHRLRSPFMQPDWFHALRRFLEAHPKQIASGLNALRRLSHVRVGRRQMELVVDSKGIHISNDWGLNHEDILCLASNGLIRFTDAFLCKQDNGQRFSIGEASSGEQAIVLSLLGIASQIVDDSLVCIDEPEVCLHPEWQERYIRLLFNTFRNINRCHFIIATHSPQIVAQLPRSGCHIMSISSGKGVLTRGGPRRSIDYQLASVFEAPGFGNEYLSRTALNVFACVSREKAWSQDSLKAMSTLDRIYPSLHLDDPIRELISALHDMRSIYA